MHKGQVYPGNHPAIIDTDLWQQVQARLEGNRQGHKTGITTQSRYLLTGKVFDTDERRFTGSHSKKSGSRSYRYYVQQVETGQPMRIPAQELEQAVLQALYRFLDHEADMLTTMQDHPDPSALLDGARALKRQIDDGNADAVRALLAKVVVDEDQLRLTLSLAPLTFDGLDASSTVLVVPAKLQRSGLAMRLVIPGQQRTAGKPDPKLIRLLARSHDWAMRLISGRAKTVREIAEAEGVTSTYVTRLAYLGLMCPDLMQAIVRGEQPTTLTAHSLVQVGALPLDWDEQRRVLGFR